MIKAIIRGLKSSLVGEIRRAGITWPDFLGKIFKAGFVELKVALFISEAGLIN